MSYVYLIQHGDTNFVKIGLAVDVENRRQTLQGGNPVQLHIIGEVPGDYNLEQALHLHFSDKHLCREWFDDASSEIRGWFERARVDGVPRLPTHVTRKGRPSNIAEGSERLLSFVKAKGGRVVGGSGVAARETGMSSSYLSAVRAEMHKQGTLVVRQRGRGVVTMELPQRTEACSSTCEFTISTE